VEQRNPTRPTHGSSGFALIEALAAIVILALSLTALLSAYRTGLQGAGAVDDHLRARLLAQSVLAEWTQYRILQPGRFHGRVDRFAWTVSVAPFDGAGGTHRQQSDHWKLHKLTVAVSWPHGRQIEINTLRLLQTK
jgi:general secretion pathway protein I